MPIKSPTSLVNIPPESDAITIIHTGSSATKPRKPFTNKKTTSADQINGWSNGEFVAGSFYPEQQEIIEKALTQGVKGEKLG